MASLNPRQQAFVREYLLSGNASDAYRRAGYKAKDVDVAGPRLLGNVGIAAAIAEGRKKIAAKVDAEFDLRLENVLTELKRIGFGGMSSFLRINDHGDPVVDLSNCKPADLDMLAEATIEDFTDGRVKHSRLVRRIKIKRIDKLPALLALGKHLGLREKSKQETVDCFTQAIHEIANGKAAAMPIGTDDNEIDPLAPED